MAAKEVTIFRVIESRFPGLIDKVRNIILESEKAYEGDKGHSESFLWEHTVHVASIALRLAQEEKMDPQIPVIAALFHDAGKFVEGKYHTEGTIEETESARIAENLLKQSGMRSSDIRKVIAGLNALYNEKIRKNRIAAILHDADFLSKFGALGIASFFTKATVRGRALRSAVLGYLSKELTYAACLPLNMQTAAGRKHATRKSRDSLKFYNSLLSELRESRIADLEIRRVRIPYPSHRNRHIVIRMVASRTCPECGESWEVGWATEKGVKCQKLSIDWRCSHCGKEIETSFCLPEIN
jgi:HD superfamily phosphodiesterase